jgi:hypothetical protein
MEWNRVYYKMGVAISSPAHLELELERARVLRHDLIKRVNLHGDSCPTSWPG